MWICRYFVWFSIYSCMGWIFETTYCTIKGGKWENRGFLYGPVCPIYGFGGMGISAVFEFLHFKEMPDFNWWQIFLISFFGSIVLEYVTSWALEKLFHAYWWDYSDMPLNVNGRVCFPASLGFGVGGVIIIYGIYPFVGNITGTIPPLGLELLSLVFMAVFAADTALTVEALTGFQKELESMEDTLNQHMTLFVESMQEKKVNAGERLEAEKERFSRQSLESRLENTKEKILAEKKRYSLQNTERMISHMDFAKRSALRRIKGFRPTQKAGKYKDQMEHALHILKERANKK